ncbi:hypothetical protein ACLB6G_04340 [Zhengella sp. ZM62]|uniref:hypothetical protein n=1 Tax=Zhengella sedimenti TaxID=3390035 RepID=UPI003975FD28
MADIATVLKKTIDGLPANTPAIRQKVYDKARGTIRARLEAREPKPSQAAIDKQMEQVDKVIAAVESDYAFREQIDSVFSEAPDEGAAASAPAVQQETAPAPLPPAVDESAPGDAMAVQQETAPAPPPAVAHEAPDEPAAGTWQAEPPAAGEAPGPGATSAVETEAPAAPPSWLQSWSGADAAPSTDGRPAPEGPIAQPDSAQPEPVQAAPAQPPQEQAEPAQPERMDYSDPAHETLPAGAPAPGTGSFAPQADASVRKDDAFDAPLPDMARGKAKKGGFKGLAIALVVLLLLGAGGYAAWLNKDQIMAALDQGGDPQMAATQPPPAGTLEPESGTGQDSGPVEETPAPAAPARTTESPAKFTQRLQPDGTETDPGPAGGGTSLGEGTSVAQVTERPAEPETTPPAETAANGEAAPEQAAGDNQPAVAVGQRAIFYEERTAVEQGTADQGNVVWSQVEESPGGDRPAEPAIRADVAFPDRDLNLRITIRRNGDETLPASHIIELVFVTPDNFPGGVIDDVLRITFKDNEQSPGTPLLGIPAKIADNFFLIALTDGDQEVTANLALMQSRPWIDIPVIYRTGRRALITMEKGLSGETVFKDVIETWSAASGTNGG